MQLIPSIQAGGLLSIGLAAFVLPIFVLLYPLFFPRLIKHPWENKKKEKNATVILAGSYNPPHRGHQAMLSYLAERYGKVVAVIGINPNKKYDVTPYQRADLLRKMLKHSSPCNVEVEVVHGYIWRYARKIGARLFFRGIRTWDKDGAEEQKLQVQNTWGPLALGPLVWPIPTYYLEGKPEYRHVSSTLVREVCKDRSAMSKLVPDEIVDDVAALYA